MSATSKTARNADTLLFMPDITRVWGEG
jgi:hypothetical protein